MLPFQRGQLEFRLRLIEEGRGRLRLDVFGDAGRRRHCNAIGLKAVDMEANRLANFVLDLCNSIPVATQPGRSGT